MDSFVSNELLEATRQELLRHAEDCPSCSAEMKARIQIRARLKLAARRQKVPSDVLKNVAALIRYRPL